MEATNHQKKAETEDKVRQASKTIAIRAIRDTDLPFVLNSWVRSSGDYPQASKRGWAIRMMQRPDVQVIIACDRADDDIIVGWACTDKEGAKVHYVYIKQKLREKGIANLLLQGREAQKCSAKPRSGTLPEGWEYDRWC